VQELLATTPPSWSRERDLNTKGTKISVVNLEATNHVERPAAFFASFPSFVMSVFKSQFPPGAGLGGACFAAINGVRDWNKNFGNNIFVSVNADIPPPNQMP
jgi:hypothetical protein